MEGLSWCILLRDEHGKVLDAWGDPLTLEGWQRDEEMAHAKYREVMRFAVMNNYAGRLGNVELVELTPLGYLRHYDRWLSGWRRGQLEDMVRGVARARYVSPWEILEEL